MVPDSFIISEQTKSIKALSFNMHVYVLYEWLLMSPVHMLMRESKYWCVICW